MKYTSIKWILNKQIEMKSNAMWCVVGNEFTCVWNIIPKGVTHLYTAEQLLNKLNN